MNRNFDELQDKIKKFCKDRAWNKDLVSTYNMLCNISEECGEVWNLMKWLSDEEDFKKIVRMKRNEFKDGIGDILWCVGRMAVIFDVNMHDSLDATIKEYDERFPVEIVKGRKGNRLLGGYDGKYDKKASS